MLSGVCACYVCIVVLKDKPFRTQSKTNSKQSNQNKNKPFRSFNKYRLLSQLKGRGENLKNRNTEPKTIASTTCIHSSLANSYKTSLSHCSSLKVVRTKQAINDKLNIS